MSTTITLNLPDNIAAWLTTPEGMARAEAAVLAAFAEDDDDATDTRTPKEKAIDAVRVQQKSHARRKRDELVASVLGGNLYPSNCDLVV
nr:hypothetical protein [Armatimonas sp.]